jgi:hypothetical protein
MSMHWRRGKLGAAGLCVAAIAVAAVPDSAPPASVATARAIERTRVRASGVAPPQAMVQLDMARLRRLQPAGDTAADTSTVSRRAENVTATQPVPVAEKTVAQEVPPAVEIVDAFAAKSWYVPPPPPPPVKPEPPPKPTAPPLPFTYMGRYDDSENPTVVMLVRGDRLYTVSEGESIDGTYRVERIDKGLVELTYLPLQEKQVLQTGEPG